jgi:hypothetical protein
MPTRAALLLALTLLFTILALVVGRPDGTRCAEDMACWDCTTMGNRTCGMPR